MSHNMESDGRTLACQQRHPSYCKLEDFLIHCSELSGKVVLKRRPLYPAAMTGYSCVTDVIRSCLPEPIHCCCNGGIYSVIDVISSCLLLL